MSAAPTADSRLLTLAGIGCGGRTLTYLGLAAQLPHQFRVVAAADPRPERLARARALSGNPDFRGFASDRDLFAAGRIADVVVIGTQDAYHVEPCLAALQLGYDVLLEKPIAPSRAEVLRVAAAARQSGRRVLVCHVLRYTPFYRRARAILTSGRLGRVVSILATEGVGAWHQSHSFVRGHWSVVARSSPMILAKSCHDMDLLHWLADAPCRAVASFGELTHFRPENAPAGAPDRCTDGCPVEETCPYFAMRYARDQRGWLGYVMDGGREADEAQVRAWLSTSPWGRCVYRSDNTAVDHQVVVARFANGITANFLMTAFDDGRRLEVFGTEGRLRGGDWIKRATGHDFLLEDPHGRRPPEFLDLTVEEGDYAGHGGGDAGLVHSLHAQFTRPDAANMETSLERSVESHLMAFAAEESRLTGQTIAL